MRWLAEFCVRRPVTTLMAFAMVVVLGLVAYSRLAVQLLPSITLPTIGVWSSRQSSPEDNLEKLTRPIESIAAELPHVRRVYTVTRSSFVWTEIQFDYGTDVRFVLLDLQDRLAAFQRRLGDRRVSINAFPYSTSEIETSYMFLSVRGEGDTNSLFDIAKDKVETQLKSIDGVARVEFQGTFDDAATVEIDPDALVKYGLDFGTVIRRINAAANEDSYVGSLRQPGETMFVRMNDRVRNIEELADIFVDARGLVRLKDVARIRQGQAVDQWVFRTNGLSAIGIELQRENGVNMIGLARKTRARIAEINETLPPGVQIAIDEDLARYVEDAINDVVRLALAGAALSLLIPLFFFRSWRLAAIVALAVPICLVGVFNLFHLFGMTINLFSIIGLAIGVGMVVDNSIVVTENSFRHLALGSTTPEEAAIRGAGEVAKALFASTATTAVVFLPLAFLDSDFRLFVREPTLALIFPLLISFFVAVTLCPVLICLAARGGRPVALHTGSRRVRELYRVILKGVLRHRAATVLAVGSIVFFTVFETFSKVQATTTSQDSGDQFFRFYMQPPPGSSLSDVNLLVSIVESRLEKMPDIERFSASFDSSDARFGIRLKPPKERPSRRTVRQIREEILDEIGEVPGARLSLQRFDIPVPESRVAYGNKGVIEIRGSDESTVIPFVERLSDALRAMPAITNVETVAESTTPEYRVSPDRERTTLYGVTANTLAEYIQATRAGGAISGVRLIDGDRRTNVTVAFAGFDGDTVERTRDLVVFSDKGLVTLGDMSRMAASETESRIRRVNRQSSVELAYYWTPGVLTDALAEDIRSLIRQIPNPGGVVAEIAGEQMKIDERQKNVAFLVLSGLILVYFVIAATFESFWVPLVVALMVALVPIGSRWGLNTVGLPQDDLADFGNVLLIGLVVNSGVVMMDRTLELMRMGYSRTRAVFSAADSRLRAILMTYLTTVIGLLPLAMQGDETSQWRPVAVVIIGGLTTSTVVTLIALPAFFLIGDDFIRWARKPFLGAVGFAFRTFEAIFDTAFAVLLAVLCVWRWRPKQWPAMARHGLAVARGWAKARLGRSGGPVRALPETLRSLSRTSLDEVRVISGLLRGTPMPELDSRHALPLALGRSSRDGGPVIDLRNITVIYPSGIAGAMRAWVPDRRYSLGAAPVKGVHALTRVNAQIGTGLFGLLGPNGAGKTTLLRCIAGLGMPTRGTVRLFGAAHREEAERLAPLIGYLPQNHGLYELMTLYEYLDYFATLTARTLLRAQARGLDDGDPLARQLARLESLADPVARHRAISRAIEEVNLRDAAHQRLAGFSGGMKQRAGIARVLLQAPPVVIVDEPTAGLDPVERVKVRLLLSQLAQGRTVLFSTHIVEDLEQSCSRIGILMEGRMVFCGDPAELRQRWQGKVWEIAPGDEAATRQSLAATGSRVLFQVAHGGREALRVLSGTGAPLPNARPVAPTLEDALLATLGERRAIQ
jgi:HAE1 family hydrophobic/amphiphilic exporter-1